MIDIRMYDQEYTDKVGTGETWVDWILNSILFNKRRINNPDCGVSTSRQTSNEGVKPLNYNKV